MPIGKQNNLFNKGIPAKFLLLPALFIFLFLVISFGLKFLPNEAEYKKDQAYLNKLMQNKIPEKPKKEVKLPVRGYLIPAAPGTCMIDAAAGIVNYLEPDIDFDKFILLSNPTLFFSRQNQK